MVSRCPPSRWLIPLFPNRPTTRLPIEFFAFLLSAKLAAPFERPKITFESRSVSDFGCLSGKIEKLKVEPRCSPFESRITS